MSYKDFAKKIGVDVSTVHNYLKGHIPKGDVLQRVRKEFNVDINWLLTGQGRPYIDDRMREVVEINRQVLSDGEGLWGKTKKHEVEGREFVVTEFKPKNGEAQDPFLSAISGLREIFDSKDQVLTTAIQANIRAFQLAVRREIQNDRQAQQIKTLQAECDELKNRIKALEELCKSSSFSPGKGATGNEVI